MGGNNGEGLTGGKSSGEDSAAAVFVSMSESMVNPLFFFGFELS